MNMTKLGAWILILYCVRAVYADPQAAPPATPSEPSGVVTRTVAYRDGDTELEGFLATPKDPKGPAPAVLVFHEWWGLNDYARRRAVQLAELGYVAFAADMYGKGITTESWDEAPKLSAPFKNDRALGRRRAHAALATVLQQPGVDAHRVAAIGYCFGGTCVLEMARGGEPLRGVVSFHGSLDAPLPAAPGAVKAAVLICHGADDPFVPAKDVEGVQKELRDAGATWTFVSYGGAVHSFTNPKAGNEPSKGLAYNARADRDSWTAMRAFLESVFAQP